MLTTVRDYEEAAKTLQQNPLHHGFSSEHVTEILKFQKQMQDLSNRFIIPVGKLYQSIVPALGINWDAVAIQLAKQREIAEQMTPFFRIQETVCRFAHTFQSSTDHIIRNIEGTKILVQHGWYLSFNLFLDLTFKQVYKVLQDDTKEALEKFIVTAFSKNKGMIFNSIKETVPERENIIREIEKAFKARLYSAVITLCYSQADGICHDRLKYGFFDTEQVPNPTSANTVSKKTHELKVRNLKATIGLLGRVAVQLKEPRNELNRFVAVEVRDGVYDKSSFNRHLVMHGNAISYGTRLNAIRAILLLDFVCVLIKEGVIAEASSSV